MGVDYNNNWFLLLFATGPNSKNSARQVLGYGDIDTNFTISGGPVASNDYNLQDYPTYVILTITGDSKRENIPRVQGTDVDINRKFAVLLFDNNPPDFLSGFNSSGGYVSASGSTITISGGTFFSPTTSGVPAAPASLGGLPKPIKGSDFDQKFIKFSPPVSSVTRFSIKYEKYGGNLYNFHGKDNLLIFEISCDDISANKQY